MDTIGDIKKLDAFLTNLKADQSESESNDSDLILCDNKRRAVDSSSDERAPNNLYDALDTDTDVQTTIANCTDAKLRQALICNLKKRQMLSKIYNKLTTHLKALEQYQIAKRNKEYRHFHENKRVLKSRLGAPFFKDTQCYPSPRNADLVEMLRNKRLPQIYYIKTITWRRTEKNVLALGVYEDICAKKLIEITRLIKNDLKTNRKYSEELLALETLFSDMNIITELAEHWKSETLENIDEEIVKLATSLGVDRDHFGIIPNAHKTTDLNSEAKQYKFEFVDVKSEQSLDEINYDLEVANSTKPNEQNASDCVRIKIEHINRDNPEPSTSKSLDDDSTPLSIRKRKSKQAVLMNTSKKSVFIESDARKRRLAKIAEKNKRFHQLILRKQAEQRMARTLTPDELKLIALNKKYIILSCISNWDQHIDWLKMSVTSMAGRHADFECSAFWNVYLNPKISKKPWTEPQNEKLKHFAEVHKFQNWDLIANELNINKTSYQCCVHFHTKLCDKHNTENWTQEEDDELKNTVELCRVGNTISWSKVAFYFKTRDRVQLYNRYKYVLVPVKKGAFSEAEDTLLLTLLKIFGKNMTKIVTYFENRQITQLRNRLSSMECPIREWSLEDDRAIIQHVHKHGEMHWKLLDIGQNTARIRHRFQFIKKWSEMNPNGDIETIQRRNKTHHKTASKNRAKIIDKLVTKLCLEAQNAKDDYKILNIPYVEKQLVLNAPALKQKRKLQETKPKPVKRKPVLDDLFLDFFKSTHKHRGRAKTHLDYVDESAKRIKSICAYLDVNLEIPNSETLTKHPQIDDFDIEILSKLKHLQTPQTQATYFIPPSPETLIGFRGLWLHHSTLYEHAKGHMKGSNYIISDKFNTFQGYHFCKAQCEQYLATLEKTSKVLVMSERQMFWRRFYALFKWPCLLSDFQKTPKIVELPVEAPVQVVKKGRPKKNLDSVVRMNQAKLAKKQSRELKSLGPIISDEPEDIS